MHAARVSQPGGGAFGSEIALWRSQQFKSNHKFAHRSRPQQRRQVVCVQMPLIAEFLVHRLLVDAHGIWKRRLKYIVVANGHLSKYLGELQALHFREFAESANVSPA